jgi:alkylated DNA repair dioxygenase AlkB
MIQLFAVKTQSAEQFALNFYEPADSGGQSTPRRIEMVDATVESYFPFFTIAESSLIFQRLLSETQWQQDYLTIYGREVPLPRLTAWYGDRGRNYTYSNISMQPSEWTELLLRIKDRIETACTASFNSVLLNLYRSGNDGVSWHQDKEPELGEYPVIASLSFGETRVFQLKHLTKKQIPRVDIPLQNGSLLTMRGETQKFWQHRIPKTKKFASPRINLTFRYICT